MRAMKLDEFVDGCRGRQTELAKKLGCQAQLVWQWSRGVRPVPFERCVQIERATGGQVRRWDLRPHDWHVMWPELLGTAGAPKVPADDLMAA